MGFCLKESDNAMEESKTAVEIAIQAKDKSAAVDVLAARIESVQEDVRELKDMRRTLESMARDFGSCRGFSRNNKRKSGWINEGRLRWQK